MFTNSSRVHLAVHGALKRLAIAGMIACLSTTVLADEGDSLNKSLGTVYVVGTRPTSLPTQIPTTIEGVTDKQIAETINARDSEDALKYLPSLNVRKRYIGDFDHAVLASRASGTGNSARSLVYADGILLSNLLGNGATFTPRWGLVTPEEIERVDVLYGPFSAAYSGNSVGAVVDYVTRMPTKLEAHVAISGFTQPFKEYSTDDTFSGAQASASVGEKNGAWSWWVDFNHLDSTGQPIVFANKLVSSGTNGSSGVPVTGARPDQNPQNQNWLILGSTNEIHTIQDHVKLKLAYDVTPSIRASYTFGWWKNDALRRIETYLRNAAGDPVYNGIINVNGRQYSLTPADFAPMRNSLEHFIHGLSIKSNAGGTWDWGVVASLYDYNKDESRTTTTALPVAFSGGAGRTTDMSGTGWNTLSVSGTWRPMGVDGAHIVDMGYQRDRYKLRQSVWNTNDWIHGRPVTLFAAFNGDSELQSIYLQDTWRIAEDWRATIGERLERWRAFDGSLGNARGVLPLGSRQETHSSPKAAIAYQLVPTWSLKASLGRAVRMPTVAELYQGSIATPAATPSNPNTADQIINNDPNLKPEKSWTSELTLDHDLGNGNARATVFHEDTRDALYSQINVTVTPNINNIQNVDHIRTTGVELAYQAPDVFLAGLDLASSVTYAHSIIEKNKNSPASVGKWQPRVPQWRANLLGTYHWGEQWTYTLGARYSGRQFSQLDNSDTNGFTYQGVSSFFVMDARVRYRIARQWTLSAGIDNLNDAHYWAFHPYTQRTYSAELRFDL
jgi:iron complex outermembrane receptor protein